MNFKIALDASNLREGGGVTHLVELLSVARPADHNIGRVIVWGSRSTLDRIPKREWLELRSPSEMERGQLARARWQRFTLPAEARDAGCDLLFAPGGNVPGNFRPFVTMSRNMLPFDQVEVARYGLGLKRLRLYLLRKMQARSFRQADGLIFLTAFAQESVLAETGPVRACIATIPHGVSQCFSVPKRSFRAVDEFTAHMPLRLVYVSHASLYKHQWHVISALAELRRQTGIPLRFDMLGPQSLAKGVALIKDAMAKHDPMGNWAFFHGAQSHSVVLDYLAKADIGIFASSCENMPNILLEKMAAGLPIACSNRGPMPECLGDAGLYFDPETPSTIVTALQEMIGNQVLRQRLSKRANEVASNFTWEHCADETFAFLHSVILETTGKSVSQNKH